MRIEEARKENAAEYVPTQYYNYNGQHHVATLVVAAAAACAVAPVLNTT